MNKNRRPEKLSDIMGSFLAKEGYLASCREAEVISKWPSIVGDRIASVSNCTDVQDGKLYVRVPSASWRQELSFMKEHILDVIKQKTRCKTLKNIVFY